jgi:hypothetical protein
MKESSFKHYLDEVLSIKGNRGSSVSIVSDYRLDEWAVGVQSPDEAKGLFL